MNARYLGALLFVGCGNAGAVCEEQQASYELQVFRGSTLEQDALRPGAPANCGNQDVQAVTANIAQALSKLPVQGRHPLRMHLDVQSVGAAPVRDLETHDSGALLVGRIPRDSTIWLHEYFHSMAGHPQGRTTLVTRTLRALEEGSADYFAATFTASPRVGAQDGREVRDLSSSARADERTWLGFALGKVDPHALGLSFARELWAEHPGDAALALSLSTCLRSAEAAPLVHVHELPLFCAAHARDAVSAALSRWLLQTPERSVAPTMFEES